ISHAGSQSGLSMKRRSQSREIGRTMMINVVGGKHYARELLQQIIFFVCRSRGTDYPDCLPAIAISNFFKPPADQRKCFFPCRRDKPATVANQRLREAVFMIGKIEGVPS